MTTTEERVQRLETLLDRIRHRASDRGGRQPAAAASPAFVAPPAVAAPPPVYAVPPAPALQAPPPRAPEAVFTVSPLLPSPLEFVEQPPLEMLGEEDVIDEISSDMLESVPPSGGVEPVDDDEQPPASSQRPRALMLDEPSEPLLDDELEVPLKTPPPESGPQAAPLLAGLGAPFAPDVDLLTSDLMPPAGAPDGLDAPFEPPPPASLGPTVEQLGQTIELEAPAGPSLELAAAPPTPAPPAHPATEDLEMPLPGREAYGKYDAELEPPPEALDELDAHRERSGELPRLESPAPAPREPVFAESGRLPIPELFPTPPADEITATVLVASQDAGPETFGRPPLESGTVFKIQPAALAPRPSTFLELLDGSIALGE